jgi:hypothetical protein
MPKRSHIDDCTQFYDWLFERVPQWEEKIMRDLSDSSDGKKRLHPEPVDVRLLPNLLRRVHTARGSERQCASRLRMPLRRFLALSQEADDMLRERLRCWLRRLPKERRTKERARRWHVGGWIGQISVEPWQP